MCEVSALSVIDGETLLDMNLSPPKFCVKSLLPQGLSILGGAPKVGKSWMMMDLCVRIAKGEPIWNLETTKGTALYLCLEDPYFRVQQRLRCITDDAPANLFFANAAGSLADDLEGQILKFVREHPDTVLVVIDTFQMVRSSGEPSYGGDYEELQKLKRIADAQRISILLVHHLRKQNAAKLICTGRDIEYRELELRFSKDTCTWELLSDSLDTPENLLPQEMVKFLAFMQDTVFFCGTNTGLAEQFNAYAGFNMAAKSLKQMMNRWRYELQEQGVTYDNRRSNSQRLVEVRFRDPSDGSDA